MRHMRCKGSGTAVTPSDAFKSGYLIEARCPYCRRIICLRPNFTLYRHHCDEWESEQPVRIIRIWGGEVVRGRSIIDDEDEGITTPGWVIGMIETRSG